MWAGNKLLHVLHRLSSTSSPFLKPLPFYHLVDKVEVQFEYKISLNSCCIFFVFIFVASLFFKGGELKYVMDISNSTPPSDLISFL